MEKLVYLVWKRPELGSEAWRERLIGPVAERLLARAPRNEALWSSLMTTRVVRGDGPGALRAAGEPSLLFNIGQFFR